LPFCQARLNGRKPADPAYPPVLKTVGDHLRKRRLDLGLRQRDVADRLGANTTTITNWELGHTEPGFGWMPAIIRFLGYDPRPTAQTVGEALRQHRTGRGMTQKELAVVLGVDPSTLARWEHEERVPTGTFLKRVTGRLNGDAGRAFRT